MAGNKSLHAAALAKKDELYTQLSDIANELKHYKKQLRGKTVLCNCDDPYESNFFKFFALKFNEWGLKKLICTCYNGSPIAGKELQLDLFKDYDWNAAAPTMEDKSAPATPQRTAYKVELTQVTDVNGDGATDLLDVREILQSTPPTILNGNGDFRSEECIALLKEADIVVTNPPFSLFREYVAQLMEYEKKFLIIGNVNAISYKEIFPLIKENKLWLGYGFKGGAAHFISCYEDTATASDHKEGMIRVSGVHWFTNLEHSKRNEPLDLYKSYYSATDVSTEYPTYDNYDAIEVSKTADIPMDYDGVMGVPITFLDKYCPEQFEILEMLSSAGGGAMGTFPPNEYGKTIKDKRPILNGKNTYARILIRKKH